MKKGYLGVLFILLLTLVSAEPCELNVSLLNQDPYPAVPGDYVKLVFQVEGIESPECNDLTFELLEDYPIRFDPGESGLRRFKKVNYLKDYESNILIPYKIQIDEAALDGANPIETITKSEGQQKRLETFDIEIKDIRASFEINIKEYKYKTRDLTIEVLNIADSDVEALTIEIPKQDNIIIKGPKRVIIGDLDSNEYSSASFEAIPTDGKINIELFYSDSVGERRKVDSVVWYDSSYFKNRIADQKNPSKIPYYIGTAIILFLLYRFYKKRKKKNKK